MEAKTLEEMFLDLYAAIETKVRAEVMASIVSFGRKKPRSGLDAIKKGTGLGDVKKAMGKLKAEKVFKRVGTGRATKYTVK